MTGAVRRSGGLAVGAALLLTARPPDRLFAQDTSAIDRGVRIGIIYRPGVRPGLVVLSRRSAALDSVRVIISRDLDYSDRFELITLPGGDSIRLSAVTGGAGTAGSARGTGRSGGGTAAAGLNYPLYQALGADFAVEVGLAADTAVLTVHDVAAGGVRRAFRARLPELRDAQFQIGRASCRERV